MWQGLEALVSSLADNGLMGALTLMNVSRVCRLLSALVHPYSFPRVWLPVSALVSGICASGP